MDKLDVTILRELTQAGTVLPARPGIAPSYRRVAKSLGIPIGTVRNRIRSMYDAGVLLGSSVYPNPNLLGLIVEAYAVDSSSRLSKREVVEKLKRSVEGLLFIQNFHGSLLGLVFVSKGEESSKKTISNINAITGATSGMSSRAFYPQCDSSYSNEELALMKRLASGSFDSYDELARELKTSLRTVKRRISKFLSEMAILSLPTMDYRQVSGLVPADMIVSYASREGRIKAEAKVVELVKNYTIYAGLWESFSLYSMMIPRVVTGTEIVESVNAIEGVKSARLEFVDEHIDLSKTLADLL